MVIEVRILDGSGGGDQLERSVKEFSMGMAMFYYLDWGYWLQGYVY